MLARLSKGLAQRGKPALKFRFDVQIDKLENLPAAVKKCRVVWSRGSKLQMTDIREVESGTAKFGQTLTAVATLYKDPVKGFEPKEYSFKVQVPAKEGASKMYTVGRADIDMAMYATADKATSATKMVPIIFKVGATTTGYLKISVASEMVATGTGDDDDALTAVSGLTGIHSMEGSDFAEQDLAGFDESTPERSRSPAVPAAPRASPVSVRRPGRLSGTPSGLRAASEARSDGVNGGGLSFGSKEEEEEVSGPLAAASNPARSVPVAVPAASARASGGGQRGPSARGRGRAADEDDDVSEMSVSPEAEEPMGRPCARTGAAASTAAPGRLKVAPSTMAFERPLAATAAQKKPEKYEGELKPLLRDAKAIIAGRIGAAITAARSAGSSRRGSGASGAADEADEDEEGEEGPSAGVRGGPPSASRARLSEALAVAQERQRERQHEREGGSANPVPEASGRTQAALAEDEARSALFGTGRGSGGGKAPAKQGAAKASGEQQGKSEDEMRAELFGAPAKAPAKGAAGRQPLLLGQTALQPAKPRAAADEEGDSGDEAETAPSPSAQRPRHAGLAAGAAERQQQLQREQQQREQQQQKRAGQQEQQHDNLRAENEKLRAQLAVLRDQMTAGEDARRQAQLREDRVASERDEFRQQAAELKERLKEAVAASIEAGNASALQEQIQQLKQQAAEQQALLEERQRSSKRAESKAQQEAEARAEAASSEASTARAAAQAAEAEAAQLRKRWAEVESEMNDAKKRAAAAEAAAAAANAAAAAAAAAARAKPDVEARAADLERRLADALRQVDESLAVAAKTEAQKRELRAQVAALSRRVEEMTETAARAAVPAANAVQAKAADALSSGAAAPASAVAEPGTPTRVATGSPPRDDAAKRLDTSAALLASEAGPLLGLPAVAVQRSGPLAAGADLAACVAGLDPKFVTVLLALQAARAAVEAQSVAAKELQDEVKLLRGRANSTEAACAVQTASESEALRGARSEAEQLRGVVAKLEAMLGDFEAEAATERARASVALRLAEGRAAAADVRLLEVAGQLSATRGELAEAKSRLALMEQLQRQHEEEKQQQRDQQEQQQQQQQRMRAGSQGGRGTVERQQANDGRAAEAAAEATEQRRRAEGLRVRVEELEGRCRALEREGAELKRRLADESEDRTALEVAVRDRLEEAGDDAAVEAVAGWEAKYARLKARYREVQEAAREEIDALHEELDRAHEALGGMEQQVAQLEGFKSAAIQGEAVLGRSAEASSRTAADLAAARREADSLMSELVSRKLELAQLAEREVIARRELYKAREANMKLASRLTKMEAQLVSGRR